VEEDASAGRGAATMKGERERKKNMVKQRMRRPAAEKAKERDGFYVMEHGNKWQ
jgi:hypothetical protein